MSPRRKYGITVKPEALQRLRLEATLSPHQLANKVGVTANRIHQLESGKKPGIRPETAAGISRALSVPVEWFATVSEKAAAS